MNRKRDSGAPKSRARKSGARKSNQRTSSEETSKPASTKPTSTSEPADEKLQKVLARTGKGSRREMESWIEDGRVSVDGKQASLGDRVTLDQIIRVDGHVLDIGRTARPRVIMYHKPEGEICSRRDPEGRPSVFDHLPKIRNGRWISIGRLDFNTSGLLLFSTDGELVNALTHPSLEIEREYAVRVRLVAKDTVLNKLRKEVMLEDGPAHFDDIVDGGGEGENHWYYVVIREGRNREVRRMWEAVGHPVTRLIRTRYGPTILPRKLHLSKRQDLDDDDLKALYQAAGLPFPEQNKTARPGRGRAKTSKSRSNNQRK